MLIRIPLALALAMAMLATPLVTLAHAPLADSTPAVGAALDTPPTRVVLTFAGELDPGGSSFTVTDAGGSEVGAGGVDLTIADRNVMSGDVTISEPGVYTVGYVSRSIDGAVLNGTYSFGYRTDTAIPSATGGEDEDAGPDTSIARPASGMPLAMIGLLLVLGGALLAARRGALR